MRKYISVLLLLLAIFLFSTNVNATYLSNDEYKINKSKLAVNGNPDNNPNTNRTDDNNLDTNNPNDNLNTNRTDDNNLDGILNNDNNNLNNNNNLDNLGDRNETLDQTNFLTVLSSGILGGLISGAIIYLLMARNK